MEKYQTLLNNLYKEVLLTSVNLNSASLFKVYKLTENLLNAFEKSGMVFKITETKLSHKDRGELVKLGESGCKLCFWVIEQEVDGFEKLDAIYDILKAYKDILEYNHMNVLY